jgi:tRNA-specific 2-thiouridylase
VLGTHSGVIHFPVGQRKRLGLSGNSEPLFVTRIDAAEARVVVGSRDSLRTRNITLRQVNWLADPSKAEDCTVKVRSMRAAVPARVVPGRDFAASVELAEAEEAIAPGQACVFYKGDRLLGGGWIAPAAAALAAAE